MAMLPSHRAGPLTLPIEVQLGQVQPEAQQTDAFLALISDARMTAVIRRMHLTAYVDTPAH